jgi:putative acetyltransferase
VIRIGTTDDYDEVLNIWEDSVRATHHFLTETDIQDLKPLIRNEYLKHVDLFVYVQQSKIVAFLGSLNRKIEMLFVLSSERGKGIGKELVEFAIEKEEADKVDVNEQNESATEFYKKMGFKVVSRDETDGQGKPFPILHMELE